MKKGQNPPLLKTSYKRFPNLNKKTLKGILLRKHPLGRMTGPIVPKNINKKRTKDLENRDPNNTHKTTTTLKELMRTCPGNKKKGENKGYTPMIPIGEDLENDNQSINQLFYFILIWVTIHIDDIYI